MFGLVYSAFEQEPMSVQFHSTIIKLSNGIFNGVIFVYKTYSCLFEFAT